MRVGYREMTERRWKRCYEAAISELAVPLSYDVAVRINYRRIKASKVTDYFLVIRIADRTI